MKNSAAAVRQLEEQALQAGGAQKIAQDWALELARYRLRGQAAILKSLELAEEVAQLEIAIAQATAMLAQRRMDSIRGKVLELAGEMSAGKDMLMVEGGKAITYGHSVHLDALSLARYLKGRLLFMIGGDDDTILDDIMFLKRNVDLTGIDLAGIIVNMVRNVQDFREVSIPEITKTGIPVLGIIPYEREFTYFSLRYLATGLLRPVRPIPKPNLSDKRPGTSTSRYQRQPAWATYRNPKTSSFWRPNRTSVPCNS